ncbi:MAG: hypothetical protein H6738_03870 [Alphaproteobacteria bacterium]|nr:hypothetical protein [Alphaproteobacteria bacterium]MCB9695907.1 hypothetical protein [Alphaproteobacteria bacterium]
MTLTRRWTELTAAVGSPSQVTRKLRGAFRTTVNLFSRREREERIARLQATGMMGERPTDWQLVLGAQHMLFGYLLPSNIEFYEHYEQSHHWQQVLRILDEPSAMMDPIGLGIDRDELVSHLIQVVHASAGYDVALLMMFEDGVSELRAQLEQLVAGSHPRQAALEAILERADYPAALLAALDRFDADPVTNWRVATVPAPEGCDRLFDWGIDTFGTPGRFMAYCRTLPETPLASVRAWFAGELRIPSPA